MPSANMLGMLTDLFVDAPLNYLQTLQGIKKQGEGQEVLRGTGEQLRDVGLVEANRLSSAQAANTQNMQGDVIKSLSDFSRQYFGRDTRGESWALGTGGAAGATRSTVDQFRGATGAREDARVADDTRTMERGRGDVTQEYQVNRDVVVGSYRDTTAFVRENLDAQIASSEEALTSAEAMRTSDLQALDDYSHQMVAGISQAAAPALQQAYQGLAQKYAGRDMNDPAVAAQYEAEKSAVRAGYTRSMGQTIGEAKGRISETAAQVRVSHAASINSLAASVLGTNAQARAEAGGTLASAYSTMTSGLSSLYSSFADGVASYDKMMSDSRALRSSLMGNIDASAITAIARAIEVDAGVLERLSASYVDLDHEVAAANDAREATLTSNVLGAWNAWAQGESQYAASLINTRLFTSQWADPFWRYSDSVTQRTAATPPDQGIPISFGIGI